MSNKQIPYYSRNFADFRENLMQYIRQYYPSIFSDFNDASIGTMMVELNSGVSDVLGFHTDRMFQETQIDYAQERRSLYALARTYGLKIPNRRPSVTILDWTCTVPVLGDSFDSSYAPLIRRGAQGVGGGKTFEVLEDIDFASPYSSGGIPNRLILPNINAAGTIINYTLVKREMAINGITKIFRYTINPADSKPFFSLFLPDIDVLSIESMIALGGTDFNQTPTLTQFADFNNNYYEVDALAQNKIFIEDTTVQSDHPGIKPGRWVNITRKFISEFTDKGFCKIIFGAGSTDMSSVLAFCGPTLQTQVNRIGDFINTNALGEVLKPNTTLFIKYRTGGGAATNLGPNTINTVGFIDVSSVGQSSTVIQNVQRSISVNNPIPAMGGQDQIELNQLRSLIKYNFAAQDRCVTLKDYKSRLLQIPGKFGSPYRVNAVENQNKVEVSILTLGSDSKLSNASSSTLKENIAEYLSDFRMLNDFVVIKDGKIINLKFEIDLYIDKNFSKSEIITNVINDVNVYTNINNFDMGENIYLSQLIEIINNVGGVLNVIDLRVFNPIGGNYYSLNAISQPLLDSTTRQVNLTDSYTLFADPGSMFEIKNPDTDIILRIKT